MISLRNLKYLIARVGISSLINLILGSNEAVTSNSTSSCTFTVTRYPYGEFCLVDTVGCNDTTEKNQLEAVKGLAKFSKEMGSEGISLVIYVMKKDRIMNTFAKVLPKWKSFAKVRLPCSSWSAIARKMRKWKPGMNHKKKRFKASI